MEKRQILIADDDAAIVAALDILCDGKGYATTTANSVEQVNYLVKKQDFDLVLLDMNFQLDTTSGAEGLALIESIRNAQPLCAIVVMTGWSSVELSVEAMQLGANDFIEKPWENERLLSIIANQLKLKDSRSQSEKLAQHNQLLQKSSSDNQDYIAQAPSSSQMLNTALQVAQSELSIVIYGDNGTGKSLLAKKIHHMSSRAEQAFVSVNMGAIPESLFESEMFGHVKGAFTDAKADRAGRFELADKGTLFLDEIANIPLSQQAKLLRVLESKEFERVGGNKTQIADVRVICATNADLTALVEQGKFRRDLLFRLAGIDITVPALKQRQHDILPLAQQCLQKWVNKYQKSQIQFSVLAEQALLAYDWPGNVRELQHCIERAVVLCQGETIEPSDLRLTLDVVSGGADASEHAQNNTTFDSDMTLDDIEKQVIIQRLDKYKGNAIETAKSLGLSRSAFYRRLEKYQL
ncbi:sigma-54-dependent Fis family transcriptional regulator [Saccharobesus litoralis]|uniref:Sigma-54-dependent Fis family transcriptional regulator n=1 Tax=Saccharobesus litoralis TaxID=2172099 RepID=A0A2S0VW89_9ALTE|nr:sigma-54 dependent transcriptional regulator [Saccharobesus litoralis]AWB68486.1 sigma-54-dependent Fis family transcriptional regulator [Saccharobesus litoralis]